MSLKSLTRIFAEQNLLVFQRALKDIEIKTVNKDLLDYPDLTYVSPSRWKRFQEIFILYKGTDFIGVCVVIHLNNWIKIGPLVLRKDFLGKGYGKKLLSYVIKNYRKKNIYIGSSNPAIARIVEKEGFKKTSLIHLPCKIKKYLIIAFFSFFSPKLITEGIRKFLKYGKRNYSFFVKRYKD